jgi:HK97 family phage prohead protease
MAYEIKNTELGVDSVKDVDKSSRRVKVVISKMGNLDHDNDVIDKNAYNKTIKERGPAGVNLIWHLTDHTASLKSAIAKFSELYVEKDDLVGVSNIPGTSWGNDMLELYTTGNINQHSVGFKTVKAEDAKSHRIIKEIFLYEGSAVLWGANDQTPTLSVGKSLNKDDAAKEYFATLKEVNNLAKLFKDGHLTDDTFELVEIRLTQATDKLKQLYDLHTLPGSDIPVEPKQGEGLLSVIKTFNNSFNSTQNGNDNGTTPGGA